MDQRIAVVTGGGTGIGAAICRTLAANGFKVGIHFNSSREKAEALSRELEGSFVIEADLSTTAGCDKIYELLRSEHASRIDVLVNNAGCAYDNPLFSATLDEFEKTVDINMRTTWYLTKRLTRLMIRRKQGRIINISSIVGSTGNPTQSVYGMTKAAIDNFSKTAAIELAEQGIMVNSIAPGFIETDMTRKIPEEFQKKILEKIPMQRMGTPDEIAEVVLFLSTSANYITGSVIHVNGGMYSG